METERNKTKGDDAEQPSPVGLGQEEQERPAEALNLAGGVVKSGLNQKPTNHQEGDATSSHSETPESDRYVLFGLGHLRGLQVSLEGSSVGFDELPYADQDCDDA